MNKIVHEHVPASALPEDLRGDIDAAATVTVTVTVEDEVDKPATRDELLRLLNEARKHARGVSTEEAVAEVRALRDEWD